MQDNVLLVSQEINGKWQTITLQKEEAEWLREEIDKMYGRRDVFVLMADSDGTMRSTDECLGIAVDSEAQAVEFHKDENSALGIGYTQSYQKLKVFGTAEEAVNHYRKT
jgi:hypothetical protein